MGVKEQVSKNYMEMWKQRTENYKLRPDVFRRIMVVGSDRRSNIGATIANSLKYSSAVVVECNLDGGDWGSQEVAYNYLHNEDFDTIIMANGNSYLEWFEEYPEAQINKVINDSLIASIIGANEFVRQTIDERFRKQIIFIGSMAYRSVLNGSAVYCAAKAGLAHFAKCLAWELAPKGYDVFCIHPSNTEGTPMTEETIRGLERYRNLTREEAESYWGACLPKQQWLQPVNIADLVKFLMSGKAEYLSGCNIDLAGGQR